MKSPVRTPHASHRHRTSARAGPPRTGYEQTCTGWGGDAGWRAHGQTSCSRPLHGRYCQLPACLSHLPATRPCQAALLHTTCPPHTCPPLQHPPPALLPQNMHAPPAHSTSPRLHPPTALAPMEEYGGGRAPPGPLHLTTPAHVHHHFLKHPQHAFPLPTAHHHHTHLTSTTHTWRLRSGPQTPAGWEWEQQRSSRLQGPSSQSMVWSLCHACTPGRPTAGMSSSRPPRGGQMSDEGGQAGRLYGDPWLHAQRAQQLAQPAQDVLCLGS